MCSQECRENLMKFSKGRSAACVTGKEVRRRERPSQWSERWLTILERSCCWRKALGEAKELWLCASQISEDRHVFFFDCSEEADRGIDHSDFSG